MDKRIKVKDVEFQVLDEGSGPVLLFVHGFPLDHTMWREQIAAFSDEYRVVAFDLRGFGGSGPVGESMGMAQLADDCANVLEALDVSERVVYCGLSLGGYIAWQFWARHARRLRALVLCDTRAAADSAEAARERQNLATRVLDEGVDFLVDSLLPKLLSPATARERPELVAEVRRVMKRAKQHPVAGALCAMATRPAMTMRLPEINVPTLLLCGADDVISPPAEMRSVANQMPRAQFASVFGAGHLAPLEQPEQVNLLIRDFLESLPKG